MESYGQFAKVYDLFMDNVPYDAWKERIVSVLKEQGISDGIVLDLGCGTGKMTRLLSEAGYDMIGVDGSEDMLYEARYYGETDFEDEAGYFIEENDLENEDGSCCETDGLDQLADEEPQILYLCQDMTDFELYGTVAAVVSTCDCINYLLSDEDLLKCFQLVNNYLDPKGLFLFDLNTLAKYRSMGDQTICENRPEGSFIWENSYEEEGQLNQYCVTFYIREDLLFDMEDTEEKGSDQRRMPDAEEAFDGDESFDPEVSYLRFKETHVQRGYEMERVKELLEEAGLEFVAAYDGYTTEPVKADSERVLFVARERGK